MNECSTKTSKCIFPIQNSEKAIFLIPGFGSDPVTFGGTFSLISSTHSEGKNPTCKKGNRTRSHLDFCQLKIIGIVRFTEYLYYTITLEQI